MTNSPPSQHQVKPSLVQRVTNLGIRLTEPAAVVPASDHHQVRLLAFLLAIFIPLIAAAFGLTLLDTRRVGQHETALNLLLILISLLLLCAAYGLSRTEYYGLAAMLTVGTVTGAVLANAWIEANPSTLYFLAVGILLSSLFLSWRSTLFWFMAIVIGMLLLSLSVPAITQEVIVDRLYFVFTISAIAMLYTTIHQRNLSLIEERSRELAAGEQVLRQARDQLELRVQERTAELEDTNIRLQAEVAARQQAEIDLRKSEEKYRRLVNEANDGFFVVDLSGTLTFANVALARIHGYESPEDLIGHKIMEFIAPAMVDEVGEKFRASLQSELPPEVVEAEIIRRDGTSALLEIRPVNILEDGRVVGSQGIVRDITERSQAEATLHQVNDRLKASVAELEQRNREAMLLAESGDLLQACTTTEEANRAIGHTLPLLFPDTSGVLFIYSPSRDYLESVLAWGELPAELKQRMFEPDECWALRRGRPHRTEGLCTALPCQVMPKPDFLLCVPLAAQGETLGVLHLRVDKSLGSTHESALLNEQLAVTCAEQIALALANLRLREALRHQSIRDPLTGLFNRRAMEEVLARDIRRAERNQLPVGVIMLDLDHFKRFNDTFSHEAGDVLLRELGAFLAEHIRGGDAACRFGGEEFVLILPETTLEDTCSRAEEIREGIRGLTVAYHGQALGAITASLGVAAFPDHGTTTEALLRAADMAMYDAKTKGRNKVVAAKHRHNGDR